MSSRGCLICLFCRYAAGTTPWGNRSQSNFEPQRLDDGYIEVIGFTAASLVSALRFVWFELPLYLISIWSMHSLLLLCKNDLSPKRDRNVNQVVNRQMNIGFISVSKNALVPAVQGKLSMSCNPLSFLR